MKKDNEAENTKINVTNLTEKSKPIFKKPFAPPLSNNNQLFDYTMKQSEYTMDFNHDSIVLDMNTLPVAFDNFFTINEEVELCSFATKEEEKIEVQSNKENVEKKKRQIEKKSDSPIKRVKILSEEIITSNKPKIKINKLNKISLTDSIVCKKPKFYRSETDILHDLMDENI